MSDFSALMGARVLLSPNVTRQKFLAHLLGEAQRRLGWQLGVVDKAHDRFSDRVDISRVEQFESETTTGEQVVVEDDSETRLRALVSECERCTGIPIHRVVVAGERGMGRGYAPEYHHEKRIGTRVLRNNRLPEVLVLNYFGIADAVLERFRPDFVMSSNWGSWKAFILSLLAEQRGIPFVGFRRSKIDTDKFFWTTDRMMLNGLAAQSCVDKIAAGVVPGSNAFQYLRSFRELPTVSKYVAHNWGLFVRQNDWFQVKKQIYSDVGDWLQWHLGTRRSEGAFGLSRARATCLMIFRKHRQNKLFKSLTENELANQRYILIALHKEPEVALNFQAPFWHNQKNLVAWLSMNLPCGYRLFVREHPKNVGRRPMAYYQEMMRYPGVDLVSPLDSQFKYIANADLVVTENGTTGWEALLLGKRVVSLARNFYEPTGLAEVVRDPSRLGQVIIRRLSEPEVVDQDEWDRRLACAIEADLETSVLAELSGYKNKDEWKKAFQSSCEESFRTIASLLGSKPNGESRSSAKKRAPNAVAV